jgi:hypothetical protein
LASGPTISLSVLFTVRLFTNGIGAIGQVKPAKLCRPICVVINSASTFKPDGFVASSFAFTKNRAVGSSGLSVPQWTAAYF